MKATIVEPLKLTTLSGSVVPAARVVQTVERIPVDAAKGGPMTLLTRRGLTAGMSVSLALSAGLACAVTEDAIRAIERRGGGGLGVFALDTGSGRTLAHRADERFLLQTTFRGILAAMVLSRIDAGRDALHRVVSYRVKDLSPASPVTSAHVAAGEMTVGSLCEAILEESDNTAANLLLARVGGPTSLTAYVRGLGDKVTRFDRYELIGGWSGIRDTTTPKAIVGSVRAVVLGGVLKPRSRALFWRWTAMNANGRTRLRASVPPGWTAGDRTGTADGICNDAAVAQRQARTPLVMAAYSEAPGMEMTTQEVVLREVGSAMVIWAGGAKS